MLSSRRAGADLEHTHRAGAAAWAAVPAGIPPGQMFTERCAQLSAGTWLPSALVHGDGAPEQQLLVCFARGICPGLGFSGRNRCCCSRRRRFCCRRWVLQLCAGDAPGFIIIGMG